MAEPHTKTSATKKNGNDHLLNEILPPVERTFPFSRLPSSNLALPSASQNYREATTITAAVAAAAQRHIYTRERKKTHMHTHNG